MQAVADRSASPKVLPFRIRMGAPAPNPLGQPQDQGRPGHDPVVHGSKAAIAAAIFAGLAMVGTFVTAYVTWSNRSDQKTQQIQEQADAHTNALVDLKLTPAVKAVNDHIDAKVGELSGQIHALDVRVARLEGPLTSRVSDLEKSAKESAGLAAGLRLEGLATQPKSPTNISAVNDILSRAQKDNVAIPADMVERAGSKFIDAAQHDPAAWKAALAFMDYRSFLNGATAQIPLDLTLFDPNSGFWFIDVEGTKRVGTTGRHVFTVSRHVIPNADAARYERIGDRFNEGRPTGPAAIVVDGQNESLFALDGHRLKNVTFKNAAIAYGGGETILENVHFVNCTFLQFKQNSAPIQELAKTILADASVTFRHSPSTHS
jgi:hypothetical protein